MNRTKRLIALAMLAGAMFSLTQAVAHETDQFTLPEGREFADLGRYFNEWVFDAVQGGVKKTNEKIQAARSSGRKAVEDAQSPDVIAHDVYHRFPNAFDVIEGIDGLAESRSMADRYPGKVVGYKEAFTNIYEHVHFPLDPRQVFRIWHAATVKAYGTYLGGDKIGHFVDMGMYYFEPYREAIRKGGDEKAAMHAALEIGTHGLIFSERGMLGYLSAGDYSNADMAANFLGLMFYRNLTEPVMLKGKTQPPMLVRDGDLWKLAPHVRRDSDFFAVFICDHLDEALNPGLFEEGMRGDIRAAVVARCERILNRRVDDHGNRRPKAWFDAKLEQMKTYYGQEYGYNGRYEEFAAIGNTCFEYAGPESDVKKRDRSGLTALHVGAWSGSPSIVKGLLDRGADVNAAVRSSENYSPEWGNTPLHYACRAGSREIAQMLLQAGANVNASNQRGQTPLHMALGSPEIVSLLLERGARIDAKDAAGRTPLHWAAGDDQAASADLLLAKGAAVGAVDNAGQTPLHRAAAENAAKAAALLIEHGADVNVRAMYGATPLHFAAAADTPELPELLLAHGADAKAADEFGRSPLHEAAAHGRTNVIASLIDHGADPSAKDAHRVTPLHLAARNGFAAAVDLLLARGADASIRSSAGATILHEAAVSRDPELAASLMRIRSADAAARNAGGKTPADLATDRGAPAVAAALRAMPSSPAGIH